jgi:hypothetical protein
MLKFIKRRHVDEEEVSENGSKLPGLSTSRAEKEVADKENRLYNDRFLAMGFT